MSISAPHHDAFVAPGLSVPTSVVQKTTHNFSLLKWVPWLTLLIALIATWQIWNSATQANQAEIKDHFEFQVRETMTRIERQMQKYEQILHGIEGLYDASESVERNEFHRYIEKQNIADTYPGINAIGFAPLIAAEKKQQHINAMHKEGIFDYKIQPDGNRPQYAVITFLEIQPDRNHKTLGYDMYSDPVRRSAMDLARDTGDTVMSNSLALVNDNDSITKNENSFQIFLPIYRKHASLATLDDRRSNLIGWVYATFRIKDLMLGIQGEHDQDIHLEIYDNKTAQKKPIFDSIDSIDSDPSKLKENQHPIRLQSSTTLTFSGHEWRLNFQALPALTGHMNPYRPNLIAIIGIGMSLLLGLLANLLVTGRERALKSARKMNADLIQAESRLRHESLRLAELIWATNIGTWEWDMRTGEIILNSRWAEVLGYTLEELTPTHVDSWKQLVHPDDLKTATALIERCFSQKAQTYECEVRMHHKDGHWIWMLDRGRVVEWSPKGTPWRMAGTNQDISKHKQTEARLQLAANVFTHAREAILITDAKANIIDINEAFCEITGYTREELYGKNPRILNSGRQDKEFYVALWQDVSTRGYWSGEIWNRRKNGEVYAELLTISAVRDANGEIQNYVSLFSDISYLKKYQQHLETIAHFDGLTGLPNRMLLADRQKQAIAQSQRQGSTLGVVYIDLDGFKGVNDCHGHDVGDKLLIIVTQRMKAALREGDTLARIGGDEFVALLVNLIPPHNHELIVQRLLQAAAEPVIVGKQVLHVSASIGVALYPQGTSDADQLLHHADQAMYQAKQSGKNCFFLYSEDCITEAPKP